MFASRTHWRLTPNRLSVEVQERRRQGLPLLDLTESNPTRCGFNFDEKEILSPLSDPRSLAYSPDPRGLRVGRQAVAGYYAERGIRVDLEQIFLTTSTSEAYSYIFRLLANPGDKILVPSPSYPLLEFLARLNDLELVPYPLAYHDGWEINIAALRDLFGERTSAQGGRTRAVLLVHPNNPTGSFVRASELEFLVPSARRHSLALVSDEVFADYALAPAEPEAKNGPRMSSLAGERGALTFTLSGLSKISALPQMKLAWIIVNGPAGESRAALERLEVIGDTYLSVNAPLAHALPSFLEARRKLQPQILGRIRENLRWLDLELRPDSPLSRLVTEGGWYVILKMPAVRSDEDWALELLRQDGVFVHPGHFFDFPAEGHLVLSLLPLPEIFRAGVRQIFFRAQQVR